MQNVKYSHPNIKFLQLNCYLSAESRTWIENLLPLPKRDGFGGQNHHRCDYLFKPSRLKQVRDHLAGELLNFKLLNSLTRLLNLNLPQAPELTTSWPENSLILALQPTMWGWSVGSASKLEKVATGWLIFHGLTTGRHFQLALIISKTKKLRKQTTECDETKMINPWMLTFIVFNVISLCLVLEGCLDTPLSVFRMKI